MLYEIEPNIFVKDETRDPEVRVDYETGFVNCLERGGWGRTYKKSFSDLEDLAEKWEVEFDLSKTTVEVADIGYRLIFAEYMVEHGLSPRDYLKMPKHGFLPPLPEPKPGIVGVYTADDMIAYGKVCVKASKK